jgi:hypothetical protein
MEIKLVSEVFRKSCSAKNQARKTIRENILASKIDGKNADEKLLFLSTMFRLSVLLKSSPINYYRCVLAISKRLV